MSDHYNTLIEQRRKYQISLSLANNAIAVAREQGIPDLRCERNAKKWREDLKHIDNELAKHFGPGPGPEAA